MKTGRNDPCPCGSGKKFKKCCLGKGQAAAGSPPVNRPILPQPSAPSERPSDRAKQSAPPPKPRDPAMERWDARWEEFEAQEGEGRIAVFLRTLDDAELMTDEMAFEMLTLLHQGAVKRDERARFAELVAALAERHPEVYQHDAHYYLSWQLQDALAENRPDILPRARELAGKAGRDIDTVNRALLALAYHGQLDALVQAMRIGWPAVQSSTNIIPWGIAEFAERATKYEIYAYLEHTPSPDPSDIALLDRIKFFLTDPCLDFLAQLIGDLTGQGAPAWTVNDFTLKPPGKKTRDEWDDSAEKREEPPHPGALNLARLITQFVGYLRREEGVPYPKGELIREQLCRYFIRRHEGELDPRPSMLEQALHPKKTLPRPPKPGHPLCPERVTFDVNLAQLLGFMNGLYHTGAALFEIVPAWLRFLESRGLIDGERHAKTLDELRPLHASLLQAMKSLTDDPTLYRNLQGWPARAEDAKAPSEPHG